MFAVASSPPALAARVALGGKRVKAKSVRCASCFRRPALINLIVSPTREKARRVFAAGDRVPARFRRPPVEVSAAAPSRSSLETSETAVFGEMKRSRATPRGDSAAPNASRIMTADILTKRRPRGADAIAPSARAVPPRFRRRPND
jgi:hypothetical protein